MSMKKQYIPAPLKSAVKNGYVTDTSEILDENKGKRQDVINQETDDKIDNIKGGSSKSIANLDSQINGNGGIDDRLGTIEQLAEISIGGGDAQIATGSDFDNPTVEQRAKIPTVGAILDSADETPIPGSKKFVESGGVNKFVNKTNIIVDSVKDVLVSDRTKYLKNAYKIPLSLKNGDKLKISFESSNVSSLDNTYIYLVGGTEISLGALNVNTEKTVDITGDVDYFTFYKESLSVGNQIAFTFEKEGNHEQRINELSELEEKHDIMTLMNSVGLKKPYTTLYSSKTSNVLDVDYVLRGIGLYTSSGVLHIGTGEGYIMSKLIPLSGAFEVTITGNNKPCVLLFLKDSEIKIAGDEYWFTINADRTIRIPTDAKYAVISLQNPDTAIHDYSSMKMSLSSTASEEQYEEKEIGSIYNVFQYTSKTKNLFNVNEVTKNFRITDDSPYFVSNTNNSIISNPIYVKGQYGITIKSKVVSPYNRYIAFTKDLSIKADSVVKIVSIGANSSGEKINTVNVPDGAVWAFVPITTNGSTQNLDEVSICYGNVSTDEQYQRGDVIGINGVLINGVIPNINKDVNKGLVMDLNKRWNPYYVGSDKETLSYNEPGNRKTYDRCNILFFTDSHIDLPQGGDIFSLCNVKDTIDFANDNPVSVDAIINSGDFITEIGSKAYVETILNRYFDEIKRSKTPFIQSIGNHDSNDHLEPSKVIADSDWNNLWYNFADSYGIVRQTKLNGQKSTWGYYDITAKKIRIIFVDVNDIDRSIVDGNGYCYYNGGNSFYIANEQLQWIVGTAMNVGESWGLLFLMHNSLKLNGTDWYSTTRENPYESAIQKLFSVCVAFNNHTSISIPSYTYGEDSFYNLDTITADFSFDGITDKPRIIAWIMGHEHVDHYLLKDGINMIWTANGSCTDEWSDARIARIPNTPTQNVFDIINIDQVTHKIRIFRCGAGENCYGIGGDRFIPDGLDY